MQLPVMRILLRSLLVFTLLAAPVQADPAPLWVRDAWESLLRVGLLKGYPDGQVGGERPVGRDELSELLERLDQWRHRRETLLAPAEDLPSLRADLKSLREAQGSLTERVDNTETTTFELEDRQEQLDRPGW